jgi:hypothetical protein
MFIKEATGKISPEGKAVIDNIPNAMVLGSFWVVPQTGKAPSVLARQQVIPKQGKQEIEKSLLLEFDAEKERERAELTVLYLGPGLRWIPTYRITLKKEDEADIGMQAEILNEAEDLVDAKVELVVGVPNFRFKDVISPMSLEPRLLNALQQAAPQLMSQTMSNVLFTQRSREVRGRQPTIAFAEVPALPEELTGEESQDLFVYHIPRLSLRAGQRAAIPLKSVNVPIRHIYTWDVKLSRSGTEAVPGRGAHPSPVRLLKNEVWHQIELQNKTDVPWTTGAALIMDQFLPIAQELLTYTSIGGKCLLPLTVSMDIRGTYSEEETGREPKAIHFDGHDYVLITKQGKLRVTNYKTEQITLIITCEFGGNATEASDDGKIVVSDFVNEDWRDFRGNRSLTGHSTISWELKIDGGKTKEISCQYFYYAR